MRYLSCLNINNGITKPSFYKLRKVNKMKNLKVNCRNCIFTFTVQGDHSQFFKIGRMREDGEIDHSVIMSKISNEHAYCPACGALLEATTLKKILDKSIY